MTTTAQQTFTITYEQLIQLGRLERRTYELEEIAEQIRGLLYGVLDEPFERLSDSAKDRFMEAFDADVHALDAKAVAS